MKKGREKGKGKVGLMWGMRVEGEIKELSWKMEVGGGVWEVKKKGGWGKRVEGERMKVGVDKMGVEVKGGYEELMEREGYVRGGKVKEGYVGMGVKEESLVKVLEEEKGELEKKVGERRGEGRFRGYGRVWKDIGELVGDR